MSVLPKYVQVGATRYTVAVDQAALNAIGSSQHTYGTSFHRDQRIALSDKLGADQEADTLLHEVLHACLTTTGLDLSLEDALAERLVYGLSAILLDTLRRNPELVAYLVGKG